MKISTHFIFAARKIDVWELRRAERKMADIKDPIESRAEGDDTILIHSSAWQESEDDVRCKMILTYGADIINLF